MKLFVRAMVVIVIIIAVIVGIIIIYKLILQGKAKQERIEKQKKEEEKYAKKLRKDYLGSLQRNKKEFFQIDEDGKMDAFLEEKKINVKPDLKNYSLNMFFTQDQCNFLKIKGLHTVHDLKDFYDNDDTYGDDYYDEITDDATKGTFPEDFNLDDALNLILERIKEIEQETKYGMIIKNPTIIDFEVK